MLDSQFPQNNTQLKNKLYPLKTFGLNIFSGYPHIHTHNKA